MAAYMNICLGDVQRSSQPLSTGAERPTSHEVGPRYGVRGERS